MSHHRQLGTGEIYHVMNKSIAGYRIFSSKRDYLRMLYIIQYFAIADKLPKFSEFLERKDVHTMGFEKCLQEYFGESKRHIQLIAYCLMPTHIHLVVKQLRGNGISTYASNVSNSYARYLNTKQKRKGPLWVGKFKSVHVETDEQLIHLTRYLHLNPTTAELVKEPEKWLWSSYAEYISPHRTENPLCQFSELVDMTPNIYKSFIDDQKDYQRKLGQIKKLLLE